MGAPDLDGSTFYNNSGTTQRDPNVVYREKCQNNQFDFSRHEEIPDTSFQRYDPSKKDCLVIFEETVCPYYMLKNKKRSYDEMCEKLSKTGIDTYDSATYPSLWDYLSNAYFPKAKTLNLPPFAIACLTPKVFGGDSYRKVERILKCFMVQFAEVEEEWATIMTQLAKNKLEKYSVLTLGSVRSSGAYALNAHHITVEQRLAELEPRRIHDDIVCYDLFYRIASSIQPIAASTMLSSLHWDTSKSTGLGCFFETVLKIMKLEVRRETGMHLGHQTTPGEKARSVKHVYRYLMARSDLRALGEMIAQNEVLTCAMVNSPNTEMPSLEAILRALNSVSERYIVTKLESKEFAPKGALHEVKATQQSTSENSTNKRKISWADQPDVEASKRQSQTEQTPSRSAKEFSMRPKRQRFYRKEASEFNQKRHDPAVQQFFVNNMIDAFNMSSSDAKELSSELVFCRENPMCDESSIPETLEEHYANTNRMIEEGESVMSNIGKFTKLIELPVSLSDARKPSTIRGIVDLGATVNCIRREVVWEAGLLSKLEKYERPLTLKVIGLDFPVHNFIRLNLRIGTLKCDNQIFAVIPNTLKWDSDMLLGMQLLESVGFAPYCKQFWLSKAGLSC